MAHASMVAAAIFVIGHTAAMAAGDDGSGCGNPVARDAHGVRRGDGGNWVPGDDGSTWFVPSDPFMQPLRATPKLKTLCMLRSGNLHGGSNDEERSLGLWIGDVAMILGRHGHRSEEVDGAQVTFAFALPEDGADVAAQRTGSDGARPKRVTLSLRFERVDAVWPPASDRVPMDDPYFLTNIDATGIEPPECWKPDVGDAALLAVTPCDECKRSGRDFFLCKDLVERLEDCYAH